ncbi:coenzyme PQQ synthesis protein D (PqqD) [Paenibacillus cellulosilyticus]|uniref:Coenzyme PQQ synthesis protein D (PqqD) n=1 Tax=Paenibacillus cellulosilyticus TaxID=375489 RepID=A0A2V2YL33_9BACL|nr:lasso peptide biosynthesis PqqD family chaperone [Paenibacillus cellulosilyticus]PWV93800.1 coenzyme PQQ synthesis protein D (PqqD) [Paenibacillus cellulosilyticus]QKS47415.1 lasso peptide biosynthesis PqqD family chaperone [Paenibacillus cellulosilyticus]
MSITIQDSVVQAQGNLASQMGGETVMMSIESGKYYNLGEIGGRIWELVAAPISVSELVSKLTGEYEVTTEECEAQVIHFLENLASEKLVIVQEAAAI